MSNELHLNQPKDQSLQAYKDWINEMTDALGGSAEDDMTEEEWTADWTEFWKNAQ